MERGEYLSNIMESKGYNAMSLSRASGVPYTTIRSMIERNLTNASIDNVIKICKVLEISVESLNTQKTYPETLTDPSTEYEVGASMEIPLFGDIAAGALATVEGVSETDVDYISIPRKLLGKYAHNNDLFVMKVNGDSMNKIIPNGSFIVCKPLEKEEMKDDDIVVFSHDGDYSLKCVRRDEDDQVLIFSPVSSNRKFRDVVIPFNTSSDLKIYAKVIWYAVTLD